jgi:hypothetical protein
MFPRMTCISFSLLLIAGASADLHAQSIKTDAARLRRANREKAVAKVGSESREFVETYGEDAVAAIFACSPQVGMKLVECHASGALAKLPSPCDLLRLIANPRHRDDVALWAVQHASELTDPDSFDAYLARPLEYALSLKPLKQGAAEVMATRIASRDTTTVSPAATPQAAQTATTPATTVSAKLKLLLDDDRVGITACGCMVMITLFALWRRRHATSY